MSRQPPNHLRVLVVEDYEDTRYALRLLLGLWGYPCESAPSGPEALDRAAAFRPDVVLMDIGLSGRMDGYEVATEMRQLPELSGAVFVATTGYGCGPDVDRSYAEGFAAHFTKPFEPDDLRVYLETVSAERDCLKAVAMS